MNRRTAVLTGRANGLLATVNRYIERNDPMPWVFDDGGRVDAGYRGDAGDCVTRAIAIATGFPYQPVYDALFHEYRKLKARVPGRNTPRNGVPKLVYRRLLSRWGWQWVPCMEIGTGCTTHLAAGELPAGRIIASVSRHLVAVIDGVIHDTHDPGRDASRCVYGYYIKA